MLISMMTIPEQITSIRKAMGYSQEEIGNILGLTAGAICNYEKGRRPIRAEDFEKIKALSKKNKTDSYRMMEKAAAIRDSSRK
ncbi:MAG: helix-turn-helix transcriptional regulator [Candidatus Omnitrophica bacterium]|nr:helix-turn-helix transcriptional regulator [Candidatus Omnitrophota bacterium]